jgi:hypothetical protein|tara:strand:+ start:4453 stop:4581 length:129 start_codon:yes stop_codon:yes gene_type:complete
VTFSSNPDQLGEFFRSQLTGILQAKIIFLFYFNILFMLSKEK